MPIDLDSLRGVPSGGVPPRSFIPFTWLVELDLVPKAQHVLKFAFNPNADPLAGAPTDIWPGSVGLDPATYNFLPSSAVDLELLSSEAADDKLTGNAAFEITVLGLDNDFNPISEVVILDGETPVTLDKQYRRIWRAFVSDSANIAGDRYRLNAGDITIRIPGPGDIAAVILANFGKTTQSNFTVPAGYTCLIGAIGCQTLGNDNAKVAFVGAELGKTAITEWHGSAGRAVTHIDSGVISKSFPEKTTTRMVCFPDLPNVVISAWYDILLLKNE